MNSRIVLLLTNDAHVGRQLRQALRGEAATILVAHNIEEALQTTCARLHELDLVLLDSPEAWHGIPLLSAIHSCREELPIIILTSSERYHTTALAYANGAAACLAKPTTPEESAILLENLGAPKLSLAAA